MRAALLVIAVAAYCAAVLFARPHATPGPLVRDFEAYYAAGATWLRGGDAYGSGIWSIERNVPGAGAPRDELLPFVNPPPLLPLLAPFARMSFGTSAIVWGALLLLALVALVTATLALCARPVTTMAWLAALTAGIAFGPISSDLALGQFALIAAAGATIAALSFARGYGIGGAAGTFLALLQPSLAIPVAACMRSRGAVAAVVAAVTGAALIWMALGAHGAVPSPQQYVGLLQAHGSAERNALIQFSVGAIAYGFGASTGSAAAMGWIAALTALVAWIAVATRREARVSDTFAVGCVLAPLALPFFHEHDFSIVFPAALIAMTRNASARMRAASLFATLLVAVDWLGIAQRPDGATQSVLLAIAVLAALLATVAESRVAMTLSFAPVVVLIVACASVAAHHAAPVWPDAMHGFTLPASTAAAAVWHAEQSASGMFARDSFFAALRALPLLGCAMLAVLLAPRERARRASDRGDAAVGAFFESAH